MKLSARNQLKGTIVGIQEGAVNGTLTLIVGADERTAAPVLPVSSAARPPKIFCAF